MKTTKKMAVLAVFLMLAGAAVVGIAMQDAGVSADGTKDGSSWDNATTVEVNAGNVEKDKTVDIPIQVNQNYYTLLKDNVTVLTTWEYAETADAVKTETYKFTEGYSLGAPVYKTQSGKPAYMVPLKVTAETPAGKTLSVHLIATVSVFTPINGTTGNDAQSNVLTLNYYYELTIYTDAIGALTGTDEGNKLTFALNVESSKQLSAGGATKFYATNLPAGLSMTPNGWISGIPTNITDAQGQEVTIRAVSEHGTEKMFTVNIIVKTYSYDIKEGTTSLKNASNTYILKEGSEVKLTVTDATGTVNKIQMINISGNAVTTDTVDVSSEGNALPTNGTGTYAVILGYEANGTFVGVEKLTIYVIGDITSVVPGVIVGSR